MTQSDSIDALAADLAKAQLEMSDAARTADNAFFHSAYATLASVRAACFGALNKHGLSVTQWPRLVAVGDAWVLELETRLLHSSGQWQGGVLSVPLARVDAQAVGSGVTYLRRYALSAVVGIAPAEDDDGEAAVGRGAKASPTSIHVVREVSTPPAANPPVVSARPSSPTAEPVPAGAEIVTVVSIGHVRERSGEGKNGRPFTKYTIVSDGAQEFTTFSKALADMARSVAGSDARLELVYKDGKFGRDLVAVSPASYDRDLEEPPL